MNRSKISNIPGILNIESPECTITNIAPILANQTCPLKPLFPFLPKRFAIINKKDSMSSIDPTIAAL